MEWPKKTTKWTSSDVPLEDGGSLLRIGDNMLCMSAKGTLTYAHVTPEKDELKVLSQYEVFPDGQYVWATPLVYKGKIYCRGMDQLVCLDPSGK